MLTSTATDVQTAAAATLPTGVAGTVYGGVLVGTAVFVGPVMAVALAVHLAAHPYRREAGDIDATRPDVLRWFVGHLPAMPLSVAVATAVVWLAPPGAGRVLATVVVALVGAASLPVLLTYAFRTRPAGLAEREALGGLPDGVTVHVVPDATRVGVAFAAGVLPGARYVFLAESLFDVLSPDERRAVLAHELAHHRRGHVALRVALPICLLVPLVAAVEFGVAVPFVGVVAFAFVAAVGLFRVVRWTEYDADRWAAERVGGAAVAGALSHLADRHLVFVGPERRFRVFASHPSIENRVARLTPARRAPNRGPR